MIVNIKPCDKITTTENTTPLRKGMKVTITFSGRWHNGPDFTVTDDAGEPKLFTVEEEYGKLGILYPGYDDNGDWNINHFAAFDTFAHTVDIYIVK